MESIVDVLLEPKRLRAVSDFVGETSKSLMSAFASVAKDNAEVLRVITGVGGEREDAGREKPSAAQRVVTFLEEPKNRNLLVDVGREFVDSAVSTYVREMGEDNMYADMFEVVRQPRNQQIFLDIMQAMVETSVRSYVLASTEVALHPESVTHHHVLRHEDKNKRLSDESSSVEIYLGRDFNTPASSGPPAHGEEDIHSPALIGNWKELFTAATENKENRELVMATTGTADESGHQRTLERCVRDRLQRTIRGSQVENTLLGPELIRRHLRDDFRLAVHIYAIIRVDRARRPGRHSLLHLRHFRSRRLAKF